MTETIWTNPYTYGVITVLVAIFVVYILHIRQLKWYAKTMPYNAKTLKSKYNNPLCTFEGAVRSVRHVSSLMTDKVFHPVEVNVYNDCVTISAFGYASILNSKADNYVINNSSKEIQLSYKNSPYILEIYFDKEDLEGGKWETMKKVLEPKDDTIID
jgi:hypothetical protein